MHDLYVLILVSMFRWNSLKRAGSFSHCVINLYTIPLMIHVWRMVTENCVWQKILKCCVWRLILKHCAWHVISKHWVWHQPDIRQMPARRNFLKWGVRRQPDAMFRNQASDVIFCDHASDVQYGSSCVQTLLLFFRSCNSKLCRMLPWYRNKRFECSCVGQQWK